MCWKKKNFTWNWNYQSRNEQAKKLFNLPLDQKPQKVILCAEKGKTIPEIEKTSPEMNKQKSYLTYL
jgi:hypothetical protein